ncbi:MAG TPA: sigma 54-interacting transcriptional regulator [Vicinamibacterales bacterium]|nr:sigma 54-interacting transcriptional regulator [Vicinamibacterales bacterium]
MQMTEMLIGDSEPIRQLRDEIECAARTDAKVLLTGESGVGKEIVARQIHARSARGRGPLMTINCAGIPETLLESELFGHVRGSFTGAFRDRPGLLEVANTGTVLLDEVGEMSLRMQGLLLRFLETGEIQRVGADRMPSRVNVRIIAATHRPLREAIEAKTFRADLYYRLNVIHLVIPPLRERRDDVPLLVRHFLEHYSRRYEVPPLEITEEALARLVAYDWPGNVRELRNVIESLVVRSIGRVTVEHLPPEIARPPVPASAAAPPPPSSRVEAILERMLVQRESFWTAAYDPFMSRDLTRDDIRLIVRRGLEQTRGSYTALVELFNMEPRDYKRFLNFLRKHQCHAPFQQFRMMRYAPQAPSKVASA